MSQNLAKLMVSYSRVDLEFVVKLVRDLKSLGIPVWLDRVDIRAGSNWDVEIEKALNAATVVLVVVSQNSVRSENVKNEISVALESGKQIFPLIIDNAQVPLMITRVQREDFRGGYEQALNKLVIRIKGVGRTAALASVTDEEVAALKRNSQERLAAVEIGQRPSHTASRVSLEAAVASIRPLRKSRDVLALSIGTLLALAAVATTLFAWRFPEQLAQLTQQFGLPALNPAVLESPAQPKRRTPQANANAAQDAVRVAELTNSPPSFEPVASADQEPAATPSSFGSVASQALSASSRSGLSEPTGSTLSAEKLPPLASATSKLTAASDAPKATYRSTPAAWRGTWLQKCTVTNEDSLRADLTVGLSTLEVIVTRYPLTQNAPCTGGFVRNTENYEVDRIEEYADGRYAVNLKVTTLMVMPSSLAYTLNSAKFAGIHDWVNTKQVNILGSRSLGYFGDRSVTSNALMYGTWRLKDRKLQYMWAKDMSLELEKRPSLTESGWAFEAVRTQ